MYVYYSVQKNASGLTEDKKKRKGKEEEEECEKLCQVPSLKELIM